GWYATGCYGYVLQIAYEWSGLVAPVKWKKLTSSATLNNLKPGDIINGTKHTIMVTGVDGNRIQFTHSNWKYYRGQKDHIVRWDEWTTVSALKNGTYIGTFKYVLRRP
ncbi:MAG: hypothetical protein IJY28_08980, partial [Clostridia bacterium]|nr:hypothetical protein [Clostridia bacterium]